MSVPAPQNLNLRFRNFARVHEMLVKLKILAFRDSIPALGTSLSEKSGRFFYLRESLKSGQRYMDQLKKLWIYFYNLFFLRCTELVEVTKKDTKKSRSNYASSRSVQ